MDKLKPIVSKLSAFMAVIAGITLVFVMLMTVLDVILRYFGRPITGIYDIVALGGAIIIGFSMPLAAEKKVHVNSICPNQPRSIMRSPFQDRRARPDRYSQKKTLRGHLPRRVLIRGLASRAGGPGRSRGRPDDLTRPV